MKVRLLGADVDGISYQAIVSLVVLRGVNDAEASFVQTPGEDVVTVAIGTRESYYAWDEDGLIDVYVPLEPECMTEDVTGVMIVPEQFLEGAGRVCIPPPVWGSKYGAHRGARTVVSVVHSQVDYSTELILEEITELGKKLGFSIWDVDLVMRRATFNNTSVHHLDSVDALASVYATSHIVVDMFNEYDGLYNRWRDLWARSRGCVLVDPFKNDLLQNIALLHEDNDLLLSLSKAAYSSTEQCMVPYIGRRWAAALKLADRGVLL